MRKIKTKAWIFFGMLGVLLAIGSAPGALYTETFNVNNGQIPKGDLTGKTFTGSVSDVPTGATVLGLTVSLNVSGGYNGSLYVSLRSPGGTSPVVLLNQPGLNQPGDPITEMFGYDGSGLNVTLSDLGGSNIQTTPETDGAVFSGTYSAAESLSGFNGSDANGTWILFFADRGSGSESTLSTLNSWSLGITAVPEPVTSALIIFASLAAIRLIFRHPRKAKSAPANNQE